MLVDYAEPSGYYLDRYREREVRRTGKRVRRSQSDVTLHSTKRPKNRKQRGETPFDKREKERHHEDKHASKEHGHRRRRHSHDRELDGERTTTADIHKPRKVAPPPPRSKPRPEEVQSKSMDIMDPDISPSATDSAKLRAIERNREKEQLRQSSTNEVFHDLGRDNPGFNANENDTNELNVRSYNYEGKPSKYESPVVAKMAELTDTARVHVTRNNQNKLGSTGDDHGSRESFHAEVSRKLEKIQDGVKRDNILDVKDGPVATSTGKHSRASRPTSTRGRGGSNVADQDGTYTEQIISPVNAAMTFPAWTLSMLGNNFNRYFETFFLVLTRKFDLTFHMSLWGSICMKWQILFSNGDNLHQIWIELWMLRTQYLSVTYNIIKLWATTIIIIYSSAELCSGWAIAITFCLSSVRPSVCLPVR